mgnify:CR=1 FL=1
MTRQPITNTEVNTLHLDSQLICHSCIAYNWCYLIIAEIVEYMKENPDAKITLTGYADKGTGSAAFNDKIAARRAQTVYNTLAAKGVAKSRMIKESKGCRVQPFEENDMNRVTICIAK